MFPTPEIYLQAEIAYRRDRITSGIVGRPVRSSKAGWRHGRRRDVSSRRTPTVVSQAQ